MNNGEIPNLVFKRRDKIFPQQKNNNLFLRNLAFLVIHCKDITMYTVACLWYKKVLFFEFFQMFNIGNFKLPKF